MAQFTLVCCNSDMCKKCSMMDIVNLEHDQSEMKVFRKNKIIWSPTSDQFWRSFPLKKCLGISHFFSLFKSHVFLTISPQNLNNFSRYYFFSPGSPILLIYFSQKSLRNHLTEISPKFSLTLAKKIEHQYTRSLKALS